MGLGSLLAVTIILILYFRTGEPIYIAAFLGAWPAFVVALYQIYVNVPIIEIETKPQKSTLPIIDRKGVIWSFLTLIIKNSGFAAAKNCTAELSIISRPKQGGHICPAPSDEPKGLKWSGWGIREPRTIAPRKGRVFLDVLIDDTSIPFDGRASWHEANIWGPLMVWAATHEVIASAPGYRFQDAFCIGDYEVEITILPENGSPKSASFILHVDSNWENTQLIEKKSKNIKNSTN
jgi:hypothetical protein